MQNLTFLIIFLWIVFVMPILMAVSFLLGASRLMLRVSYCLFITASAVGCAIYCAYQFIRIYPADSIPSYFSFGSGIVCLVAQLLMIASVSGVFASARWNYTILLVMIVEFIVYRPLPVIVGAWMLQYIGLALSLCYLGTFEKRPNNPWLVFLFPYCVSILGWCLLRWFSSFSN